MERLSRMAALLMLGLVLTGSWSDNRCTLKEFLEIQHNGFDFSKWEQLYKSYSMFKQCDDGGEISESYSESVVHLLVYDWSELDRLVKISNESKEFKKFVLKHIDATTSNDDLVEIVRHATIECPVLANSLCIAIALQAKSAIAELNATH